jgi:pre-mRNA-splicing factor ATP-dependent RNA helicase DHX15/PRP43
MAGDYSSASSKGDRKRSSDASDTLATAKRIKKGESSDEQAIENNPYLAHLKQETGGNSGEIPSNSILHKFSRRETTAKQASEAEDGNDNPFTGEPHSQQYFKILKGRRDLPVHKQR